MDVIRLRTMARKSVFEGGSCDNCSVQQMLNLKAWKTLRWIYYNCSNISFLPDILDEIGITDEWRIAKPGTDKEKGIELDKKFQERFNRKLAIISEDDPKKAIGIYKRAEKRSKSIARAHACQFRSHDRSIFNKGAMQRRNHGHR